MDCRSQSAWQKLGEEGRSTTFAFFCDSVMILFSFIFVIKYQMPLTLFFLCLSNIPLCICTTKFGIDDLIQKAEHKYMDTNGGRRLGGIGRLRLINTHY